LMVTTSFFADTFATVKTEHERWQMCHASNAAPVGRLACPCLLFVHLCMTGTVLDTETLVLEVVKVVVESHGGQLTAQAATQALGMRPIDAWSAVARTLNLKPSAQELFEQSEPLLQDRWASAAQLGPC
jgi:riboflavin kinase